MMNTEEEEETNQQQDSRNRLHKLIENAQKRMKNQVKTEIIITIDTASQCMACMCLQIGDISSAVYAPTHSDVVYAIMHDVFMVS